MSTGRRQPLDVHIPTALCVSATATGTVLATALAYTVCPLSRKKEQKYFLHHFNKFRRIAVIFGMHHRECTGKLLVERMFSSPNPYCYFTLQNDVVVQRSLVFLHYLFFVGACRIFLRSGSGDGSFPVGFRGETPVGSGVKPPGADMY